MNGVGLTRRQLLLTGALVTAASTARSHDEVVHVVIDKLVFTPAEVTANPGGTIEWINRDRIAHTATVKDGWEVVIPPGKTASRVVEATDTVDYYCRFHPNMKGRIVIAA